ncbi:MAG: transglycosylase SLT domain-containing protein [Holosporales bacterium]|nr:transglycosylase SLT domain-containing protein [Holosporales bacterium]
MLFFSVLYVLQFVVAGLSAKYSLFLFACVFVSGCNVVDVGNDVVRTHDIARGDVPDESSEYSKSGLRNLIENEEEINGIPNGLLNSIAAVESEHDPFAVNFKSKSYHFKSKCEAVKFIEASIKNRGGNISIGCLQLHYRTHGCHFSSISDMITPKNNVSYAAHLLRKLYNRHGSWETAVKMYHNSKAKYNESYYRKVTARYGKHADNNLTSSKVTQTAS